MKIKNLCEDCKWFYRANGLVSGDGLCFLRPPHPEYGRPIVEIDDYCIEFKDACDD